VVAQPPYPDEVFGTVVDLILLVLIIMFAVNGYRQGFLVGALSFVGFFGGALVGLQLAPLAVAPMSDPWARILVSLLAVFGLALGGQAIAAWAGTRLRHAVRTDHARRADDVGGIAVSVIALLLVAWMVAGPLAHTSIPAVASSVRNSVILGAVDSVMPSQARVLYNGLRNTIANGDFPDVFGDMTPTQARQVAEPDPALANSPAVKSARQSVVKVTGSAPSCRRRIEGSGFVFAAGKVMTNAHVVAGTRGAVTVEVDGSSKTGRVVYFNPDLDLAVVNVPGLRAPPLNWAPAQAQTEDGAIVVGYPLDGPFTAVSARIRDVRELPGSDIYKTHDVTREIYTLRATVRSGNSGGPLISPDGQLLGVIFAAAVDDPDTGFALTADEARPVATATAQLTQTVDTQACTE
jgi:S1-C subfamily serine protease